jgi:hypothetical protein
MPGTLVGVLDATWTLIAWNRLYAALLGDISGIFEHEHNDWRSKHGNRVAGTRIWSRGQYA